ncbi:MAG: hypothetical protein AAGF87_12750 [Bacteroidota bacterium]
MNNLEKFFRENRDEPLANRQPGPQDWERIQHRLSASNNNRAGGLKNIFLIGLALFIGLSLSLLFAQIQGRDQSPSALAKTETKQNTADQRPQEGQSMMVNSEIANGDINLSLEQLNTPTAIENLSETNKPEVPSAEYAITKVQPRPAGQIRASDLWARIDEQFDGSGLEIPVTNGRASSFELLDPIVINALETRLIPIVSTRSVKPILPRDTALEKPRLFSFSARLDVGLLMGEGGVSAIAQPIVEEPEPGQNLQVQLLPDGSPVYTAGEGEQLALATSAKSWYRLNIGLTYRSHWRLGVEIAYGTLSRQRLRPSFQSSDERLYTVFAREERAWLFGPSIEYVDKISNWTWSIGVTGLIQRWSESTSNRQLLTPDVLYSTLLETNREKVTQFVPVIDLRAGYQLTSRLAIGPSFSILPLKRSSAFPNDWSDAQNWWSGQISVSYGW